MAGYIDSTGNLASAHDAATVYLGAPWRMPAEAEWSALINNCTTAWVTRNGVAGWLVTGKAAYALRSIFLPAAGLGYDYNLNDLGSYGYYWSSSPGSVSSECACYLYFYSGYSGLRSNYSPRYSGMSVRPLRGFANDVPSAATTHLALDMASGTRTAVARETIRYGATWETTASGATAEVSVNGVVVTNAIGSGTFEWTPTRNGTYTLTHKVLVNGESVGEVLTATFVVEGLNPENPVITPVSGTVFDSSLTVSMSCPSEGATIHYTVDGSEPTMESPIYKRFRVSGKVTVKARAFWENGEGSEVVTAEYALGQCEDPVISLRDGTVFLHSNQQVSIRSGEEGTLRYTLDGSEPTVESPVYSGPFTISESTVVKAKVFSDRFFDSKVVTANLTRQWVAVATPVITAVESFQGSKTKVVIDCATPGALIRYTTNGNDPNSHSTKYRGPIYVTDSCTVKAYAVMDDYLNSGIASRTVTKVWGIGDTLGKPDHAFTTSGDAGFVRVDDTTATLGESMRSGAIVNSQTSILETVVMGPGALSFKWKVSCEEDEELHAWDHAEFCVDGIEIARIDGITEWQAMSLRIEGDGAHVVEWRYVKDDVELDGEDCMWVSDYDWKSDYTATRTGNVSIPYAWMLSNCPDVVDEYASYEAVAKQLAANGHNTVEEVYIAGLDPADPSSELRATVTCDGGKVYVGWTPNLNTNGTTRIYKLFGRTSLVEGAWETPIQPWHRFFKVSVTMPDGKSESDEPGLVPVGDYPADANGMPIGVYGDVLVLDVSGGSAVASYPTVELSGIDIGRFNCDVYKTDKIVLRKVPAGTYYCQPRNWDDSTRDDRATQMLTTHGFWIGVFPVTQRQYELVMGTNPSCFKTDDEFNVAAHRPVDSISWDTVRGGVPAGTSITVSSPDSFIKRLVVKTGLSGFDLPTEAQWEMACRANVTANYGAYWNGSTVVETTVSTFGEVAWYSVNSSSMTHAVGGKRPNPWGFYDMLGNVWEWCRDIFIMSYNTTCVDSPCIDTSFDRGVERAPRGGSWSYAAQDCRPSSRNFGWTAFVSNNGGFRLSKTLP